MMLVFLLECWNGAMSKGRYMVISVHVSTFRGWWRLCFFKTTAQCDQRLGTNKKWAVNFIDKYQWNVDCYSVNCGILKKYQNHLDDIAKCNGTSTFFDFMPPTRTLIYWYRMHESMKTRLLFHHCCDSSNANFSVNILDK